MNFKIRQERPEDFAQTEDLTREAFWNQYAPGCSEHFLLHIMRDCPAFVKDLDLVAVLDHRIVGNVVFVKGHILTDNRTKVEVLTLGPISVHPDFQLDILPVVNDGDSLRRHRLSPMIASMGSCC